MTYDIPFLTEDVGMRASAINTVLAAIRRYKNVDWASLKVYGHSRDDLNNKPWQFVWTFDAN